LQHFNLTELTPEALAALPVTTRVNLTNDHPLPTPLRRALVRDPEAEVRAGAALRVDLDAEDEARLANDRDPWVLEALAGANLPEVDVNDVNTITRATQLSLARSPAGEVRAALGQRPGLCEEACTVLTNDLDPWVLHAFVAGPSFTPSPQTPVRALMRSSQSAEYLEDALKGCDPEAVEALAPTWVGTLEDLLVSIKELD
jgi:hypothetical protein